MFLNKFYSLCIEFVSYYNTGFCDDYRNAWAAAERSLKKKWESGGLLYPNALLLHPDLVEFSQV